MAKLVEGELITKPKHAGGRPLKFRSLKEFQRKVDEYFDITPITQQTITGLALHLGTFKDVLIDYQKRDEFAYAVKTAKQRVEYSYELSLRVNGRAGDIFALKNFGWRDTQQLEVKSEIAMSHNIDPSLVTNFNDYMKQQTITDGKSKNGK